MALDDIATDSIVSPPQYFIPTESIISSSRYVIPTEVRVELNRLEEEIEWLKSEVLYLKKRRVVMPKFI